MNNKKFIDYVREGSLSPDDDIRNQTEAILLEMRNRDPANFLFECVEAFKNPNENNVTRLTTATILRVSLKDMNVVHDITQDKGELLWDLIPNDLKDYIKEACLGHLESKVQPIMESAAQLVSVLYVIELKNNAWDNMVISLSRMLTESTLEYRIPCIITLGFICEELHGKPYNMSMSQSETILTGLLFCVSETEQDNRIRLTAMKALQNSVKYYTKILEDSKAQELFFESLMFNITKTDTSVARTAIEVLLEVVRPLYQYLDRYLSVIVKYMAEIISNSVKTPSMAIIATELFGVIAVYELEIKNSQNLSEMRSLNGYTLKYYREFLPPIMLNLKLFKEDDGDMQNSIFSASINALIPINQCLVDECIAINTDFIEISTTENTKNGKVAALTAYRCFISAITKPMSYNILQNSFSNLVRYLTDPEASVRHATADLLSSIAETRHETFLSDQTLQNNYKYFSDSLKSPDEKLSNIMCGMFEKLIMQIADSNENNLQVIMPIVDDLSGTLIENAFRPINNEDTSLIDASCKALIQLVMNVYDSSMILIAISKFAGFVEKAVNEFSGVKRTFLLEGLFMAIGMSLSKLRSKKVQINMDLLTELFKMTIKCCEALRTILGESLYLMTAIGICMKKNFTIYVETYQEYITEAIMRIKNNSVIQQAYEGAGQMCRENPHVMRQEFLSNTVLLELINRLKDATVPLEERAGLFLVVGDLSIGDFNIVSGELPYIFGKYEEGLRAVAELIIDRDSREVAIIFRDRLIDSMTCVIHSLYEFQHTINENTCVLLSKTLEMVCEFAEITTEKNAEPSVDYVLDLVMLIADIVMIMKNRFMPIARRYKIGKIVDMLHKHTEETRVRDCIKYYNQTMSD